MRCGRRACSRNRAAHAGLRHDHESRPRRCRHQAIRRHRRARSPRCRSRSSDSTEADVSSDDTVRSRAPRAPAFTASHASSIVAGSTIPPAKPDSIPAVAAAGGSTDAHHVHGVRRREQRQRVSSRRDRIVRAICTDQHLHVRPRSVDAVGVGSVGVDLLGPVRIARHGGRASRRARRASTSTSHRRRHDRDRDRSRARPHARRATPRRRRPASGASAAALILPTISSTARASMMTISTPSGVVASSLLPVIGTAWHAGRTGADAASRRHGAWWT